MERGTTSEMKLKKVLAAKAFSDFISFHTWFHVKININTFVKYSKDIYVIKLFISFYDGTTR